MWKGLYSECFLWHDPIYDLFAGKLSAYDADGDGDFDVEDAKVLLGKCIFNNDLFVTSTVNVTCA